MNGSPAGRILGLDLGSRRIGVAVSDELRLTAHGLETLPARPRRRVFEVLKDLVREYNVTGVVVGLPVHLSGSSGDAAREAERFAEQLGAELAVRIHMVDERFTTVMAERALLEADLSRSRRKKLRDRVAAVLILQQYLDMTCHG